MNRFQDMLHAFLLCVLTLRLLYTDTHNCGSLVISPTLYQYLLRQYFFDKKLQSQTEIRDKQCKTLSYKKLSCDSRLQRAFTACGCVFKEITLVGSNQGNYFENATACSKRTLKTTVATQLNCQLSAFVQLFL